MSLPGALDGIQIASPCQTSWERMKGDDRVRFCNACRLRVYNLSDMTSEEATNLVFQHEGRLCVRFFRRHDGTVLTRDCPLGWKERCAFFYRTMAALVLSFLALFALTFYRLATGQRPLPGLPGVWLERILPWEEPEILGECVPPPGARNDDRAPQ